MDAVAMRCVYRKTPTLDRAQLRSRALISTARERVEVVGAAAVVQLRSDAREEVA
jgi:hypothetical protein